MPAQAIVTDFDQPIEGDVLLESIDGQTPAVQTTLKNAENVYKSFLYLRKMYSNFPAKSTITSMATIDYSSYTGVPVTEKTTEVLINNFSGSNGGIKINGGEYILQPGERTVFPIVAPDNTTSPPIIGDSMELNGNLSYVMKNIQEY